METDRVVWVGGSVEPVVVNAEVESKQYESLLDDRGVSRRLKIYLEVDLIEDKRASELLLSIEGVSGPEEVCPRVKLVARLVPADGAAVREELLMKKLVQCRNLFENYRQHHMEKCGRLDSGSVEYADTVKKAERNGVMVKGIEETLREAGYSISH
jgi:hypothetical protein